MRSYLFIFIGSFFTLLSCGKNDTNEVFEYVQRVDFTIDAGLNTIDTYFFPFDPLTSPLMGKLEEFKLTFTDIAEVQPKSAEISSIFGDENLEFIRRISVRVHESNDVLNATEIFYSDPTPLKKSNTIRPFPNISEVKDIMINDFYGIELRLDFRYVIPKSIEMKLEYKMRVTR